MGDPRFYSEEAFEDSWLLEHNWTTPIEKLVNINVCDQEFGLSPHNLDKGFFLLEEISSIEDNVFSKQISTSINDQWLQDSNFSSHLFDASNDPNSNIGSVEKENDQSIFRDNICTLEVDSNKVDKQVKNGSRKRSLIGKESRSKERKSNQIVNLETVKRGVQNNQVLKEDSFTKKQDHNAKERMRRMKLHKSYLALGSLLPISKISKKRWTAPIIMDKILDYIPELETEIEKLTHEKNRIVSVIDENKKLLAVSQKNIMSNNNNNMDLKDNDLTVSVNEVRRYELILQICRKRYNHDDESLLNVSLSKLIQNIEDENIRIITASTLHVCDERVCYNIHIQMDESSSFGKGNDDYITALKQQFISWFT